MAPLTSTSAEIVIIGGGIAGLSLAAAIGGQRKTVLLEAESSLAYHTSSRSGQQMQPTYGPAEVRAITNATLQLMPAIEDAIGHAILTPRPLIWCELSPNSGMSEMLSTVSGLDECAVNDAVRRLPALRAVRLNRTAVDELSKEVKVASLLEYYASTARAAGVEIITDARVLGAVKRGSGWAVETANGCFTADVVVNAAGAWADTVAATFGLDGKNLVPYRRTVAVSRPTGRAVDAAWPMAADVGGSFYFRADGEDILASPMEDLASEPEDAKPDDADVASIVSRINAVTDFELREPTRSWTGLRTVATDGIPVVGADPDDPTFYWLAGQGGYGIQTSAALARLASADLTATASGLGAEADAAFGNLSPARFASTERDV